MMRTRCWCALGVGRGVEGLRWRFCSRPCVVLVYCQARIVLGREMDLDIVEMFELGAE